MKNRAGKLAALAMAVLMFAMTLTGCLEVNGERVALIVGNEKYAASEAKLYFYYQQYVTEVSMASLVTGLFGDYETYWAFESDDYSSVDACRQDAMKAMAQTKILVQRAEKDGITLTADEEAIVTKAVNRFMREDASSTIVNLADASKEDITKFITENAIANKEYLYLTDGIDTSYDYEDVQRKRLVGFTIMGRSEKDEDGNEIPQNTDEYRELMEKYSAELLEKIKADQDVETIAAEYEENEEVSISSITDFDMEKPEGYEEGTMTSYNDLGWSLKTGEAEKLVMLNSADKYVGFVFYCKSDDDEDFTSSAIASLMGERREALFEETYKPVLKAARKVHVYLDVLEKFYVSQTIYKDTSSSSIYY